MYKKIRGGSKYTVGDEDLAMDVYLPPVGKVQNVLNNGKLEDRDILFRSTIPEEQYWERPAPPEDYTKKRTAEIRRIRMDPHYFDPELEEYRMREWDRRLNGVWFMNYNPKTEESEPQFVAGAHYFYMVHWKLDNGYPKFRHTDKEWWYFIKMVEEDPFSRGMIEMTKRRQGKTMRAGCWVFEGVTRRSNCYAGIQSKNDNDAFKTVFRKAVVTPSTKLLDFWMPEYDIAKGDKPKKEYQFTKSSRRGKGDDDILIERWELNQEDPLNSWIEARSSSEEAFDGEKMHYYVADESGKPIKNGEVDVYDRHDIIHPTLEDDEGYIIGKALYTTTFDDKEAIKGVKQKTNRVKRGFKKLWNDSDQTKRDDNGETLSGLYRYYTSAARVRRFDKYGCVDEAEAYEFYLNKRKALAGDPTGLQAHIRKFSLNWMEALRGLNDECLYDETILNDRIETLEFKKTSERGNLRWKDGERFTEVEWLPNPNGRFQLAMPLELIAHLNEVKRKGRYYHPMNAVSGIIGCDPYNKDRVRWGVGSLGSGAAYLKYGHEDFQDTFILTYAARPEMAKIFFEDMVKMCWLLSMPILIENQKEGIITYFEDNNMKPFIMGWEGSDGGIPSTTKNVIMLVEETEAHIVEHGKRENIKDVLEEWKEFSVEERTRFDLGMSTGWALVGANKIRRKVKRLENKGRVNLNKYTRTHKMRKSHVR